MVSLSWPWFPSRLAYRRICLPQYDWPQSLPSLELGIRTVLCASFPHSDQWYSGALGNPYTARVSVSVFKGLASPAYIGATILVLTSSSKGRKTFRASQIKGLTLTPLPRIGRRELLRPSVRRQRDCTYPHGICHASP